MTKKTKTAEMASDIVSAYVSANPLAAEELPKLISAVYSTLDALVNAPDAPEGPAQNPAVPIEESITEDYLICLEDGKPFKSLKRHLRTKFDLTPQAYREKWGLAHDYPMVAPSYARERSKLAKKMGLGRSED